MNPSKPINPLCAMLIGLFFCALQILHAGDGSTEIKEPLKIFVMGKHEAQEADASTYRILAAVDRFIGEKKHLRGRPLERVSLMDGGSLETARLNAETALEDENHLVTIGHVRSSMALPIARLYGEKKKLYFTPTATSTKITEIGGTVFQLSADNESQAKAIVFFARRWGKSGRILILENKTDMYSKDLTQSIKHQLEIENVVHDSFSYSRHRFPVHELMDKIANFKPTLLILPDLEEKAADIANRLSLLNKKIPILGTDGWGANKKVRAIFFPNADQKKNEYYYVYQWHESYAGATGPLVAASSAFTYQSLHYLAQIIEKDKAISQIDIRTITKDEPIQAITHQVLRKRDEKWGQLAENTDYFAKFKENKTLRSWLLLRISSDKVDIISTFNPNS